MIRFQPDDWRETLLRPIAMAAPDAGIYIEIMAPDFRFVFALGLLLLLGAMALRAPHAPAPSPRVVLVLVAALGVAFVPWIATTANGRYFVAGLLVVGPVCVGLAWLLPATRAFRLTLAVGLVALQAFAVQQSSPWQAWGLAQWKRAPYFAIDVPDDLRTQPATLVTMSSITYSLVAPQFHPESSWMSLQAAPAPGTETPDSRRSQALLANAARGRLLLLVPVVPGYLTPERLPTPEVSKVIDEQLRAHRLAFEQPQACRFLASGGLASMALGGDGPAPPARDSQFGFWVCQLTFLSPSAQPQPQRASRYGAVFASLEAHCPRFFPPGQIGALAIPGGEVRNYSQAEMKVYVLDSGDVLYKYYRAFNPVRVGSIDELLAGKVSLDCGKIRGRSGLPWEREI